MSVRVLALVCGCLSTEALRAAVCQVPQTLEATVSAMLATLGAASVMPGILLLHSITRFQKSEVNRDPLSDIILLGSPWGLIICRWKWSARSSGFMVPWQAMKYPIFMRRSIITHNASFPLLVGSAVIKSIDIVSHGWCGSSSGFSSPNSTCRIGLMRWQVSLWSTYLCMYFRCLGQ